MSPYSDTIVNSFKFGYLQPAAGLTSVGVGYKVIGTSVSIYAAYMAWERKSLINLFML